MNLGDLAFRLILILFPGVIATLLYRRLIVKKKWESIDIGLNTLLFGILSYLLLQLIYLIFRNGELIIWQRLQDNQSVPYLEILWASLTSIITAGIVAIIVNRKWINRLANWLGITFKYGEDNLFYTYLSDINLSEVHIKDPTNNLIYTGYVIYYSEDEDVREIVLSDVDLFEYDSAIHMNSLKSVYLNRAKTDNLIIEVPKSISNEKTKREYYDPKESHQKGNEYKTTGTKAAQNAPETESET